MTAAIRSPWAAKAASSESMSFQVAITRLSPTTAGVPLEPGTRAGWSRSPHSAGPGWADQWIASDQPW